jgi:hypothetical protein
VSTYIAPDVREFVYSRAGARCEYCLLPETAAFVPLEVDHIIARKHGGPATADNLALACSLCNKHKGSDLTSIDPETGEITPLFHPRQQKWYAHFRLEDASIVPLTASGRVTVRLLQLNAPTRIAERRLLVEAGLLTMPDS